MKFTIEKNDLLNLLGKTQNIVERRNTMPVLTNVLLDADQQVLKVFATDLEVSLTDQAKVQVQEPGRIAIDAKNLFNIIKELGEDPITLTKKTNNWVEIKQKKSVFNLVGLSPEEYPLFPSYSARDFTTLKAEVLLDMIEKTIYSVSNDETRYHLNGVYFEQVKKDDGYQYRMVATDGHRLSLVDRKTEAKSTGSSTTGVIIPRKGLHEIRKILEAAQDDTVEMATEGSQLILRHAQTVLMIRLIEGKYPNYQQLIPQNLKRHVLAPKELLVSSLRRVSLLSNQKSKGVTLTLNNGMMQITSNNPEMGDAKEDIEVEYSGEELKIGFNARYLLDILNSIEDDSVDIQLNDQLSPGLIRPHQDKNYTCIVMPMRI
jgi:DNA polymerase III subunit beta